MNYYPIQGNQNQIILRLMQNFITKFLFDPRCNESLPHDFLTPTTIVVQSGISDKNSREILNINSNWLIVGQIECDPFGGCVIKQVNSISLGTLEGHRESFRKIIAFHLNIRSNNPFCLYKTHNPGPPYDSTIEWRHLQCVIKYHEMKNVLGRKRGEFDGWKNPSERQ